MDATVLLVLLTLKGSAPLGVNFVNFDAMEPCRKRAAVLQDVLEKGGIRVVENRCLGSSQHFTKHRHRKTKGDHGKKAAPKKRIAYLIRLDRERAFVTPQADMKACATEKNRLAGLNTGAKFYCALSEQEMLTE